MTKEHHKTDFFVVGVVKAGTTSLYGYLKQHPRLFLPTIKELNYFSRHDINPERFAPGYKRDVSLNLENYFERGMREMLHIAHIDNLADYSHLFQGAKSNQLKGDISNSYMICPSTAKHINTHNPDAKIIVVLRNPINRVWSHYLMNLRDSRVSSPDFLDELEKDICAEHQGWGVNHQYLALGNYAEQWSRYTRLFPENQLLPILFEDFVKEPLLSLQGICRFLSIDQINEFDTSEKRNRALLPRNSNLNKLLTQSGALKFAKDLVPRQYRNGLLKLLYTDKYLPQMSARERDYLRTFYINEVNQLSILIERPLNHIWKEFNPNYL